MISIERWKWKISTR